MNTYTSNKNSVILAELGLLNGILSNAINVWKYPQKLAFSRERLALCLFTLSNHDETPW